VQVGDPFQEKLLLEACLELMATDAIVGIQDMGAAGLTSSSVEMAGRAGNGLLLDLDAIPTRETGMTPYELLLSESQERMLLVAKAGKEDVVRRVFEKWDLQASVVGRVTPDGTWRCRFQGREVCAMPVKLLTDEAPQVHRPMSRPPWQDDVVSFEEPPCTDPGRDLVDLVGSPDHCSREWVWSRYDHQVGANTTVLPGADAAVVRIRGTNRALALAVDCNGRHVFLDPERGSVGVIAECARNLACAGAVAVGATDCLNFGSPERPAIEWQFARAIDGLARGCRALGVPIVSGNVSFYNETDGRAVLPTPTVAMVGLIEGALPSVRSRFARDGLEVAVLGAPARHGVGGSSWMSWLWGLDRGAPPPVDLAAEAALHTAVIALVRGGLVEVAHDVSDGGLALAVAECCTAVRQTPAVGFVGELRGSGSVAGRLFGEDHGRVVVAYDPRKAPEIDAAIGSVPRTVLGRSGGDRIAFSGVLDVALADVQRAFADSFGAYMSGRLRGSRGSRGWVRGARA
jgi:phosphoribosylformylglycinamidine synthase